MQYLRNPHFCASHGFLKNAISVVIASRANPTWYFPQGFSWRSWRPLVWRFAALLKGHSDDRGRENLYASSRQQPLFSLACSPVFQRLYPSGMMSLRSG